MRGYADETKYTTDPAPCRTLRDVLDGAEGATQRAHHLISELEDRHRGPTPRAVPAEKSAQNGPQVIAHPGVRHAADVVEKGVYELCERLERLLGEI